MAKVKDARARVSFATLPSQEELSILRNREYAVDKAVPRRTTSGRDNTYGMTAEQAIGAASLMDRSQVVSPLAGLPVSASTGDFAFAKGVLGKATGADGLWDDYWEDDQAGYGYQNAGGTSFVNKDGQVEIRPGIPVTSGRNRQAAPISLVPTATTNPDRPRTVAAGFDESRGVLTTVFRDGTFYNYYGVDRSVWDAFKVAPSKGRFIVASLDAMERGTANMAKSPVYARESLYRIARTGQLVNDGQVALQMDRSLPPRINPTKSRSRNSLPPKNGKRKVT